MTSFVRSSHDGGGRAAARRGTWSWLSSSSSSSWIGHNCRSLILAAVLFVTNYKHQLLLPFKCNNIERRRFKITFQLDFAWNTIDRRRFCCEWYLRERYVSVCIRDARKTYLLTKILRKCGHENISRVRNERVCVKGAKPHVSFFLYILRYILYIVSR